MSLAAQTRAIATRFSRSGLKCVPVIIQVGEDVVTDFGPASAPAISPAEFDYPVQCFTVTVHFPFPVFMDYASISEGRLILAVENNEAESDIADFTLQLDYEFSGRERVHVESAVGETLTAQVEVTGAEPIDQLGASYDYFRRLQ